MTYIPYEEYEKMLLNKLQSGNDMYKKLLDTVIKNPERYSGIFRVTNAKSKLVQNLTQSREILFGDFLEDIVTKYIALKGFQNLRKKIISNGEKLSIDQYYMDENNVYLVEQKVRDDHDSAKKRGQFNNFLKKY